jgi:glyoxylate reductase
MNNILVTRKLPSSVLSKLEAVGDVDLYAGDMAMPHDELRSRIAGECAVATMLTEQIDTSVIDAATDLKIVANVAVGYNNIDVASARSRGIIVTNTPDVLTESVADFTWALILAVTRSLSEGERLIRRGNGNDGRWISCSEPSCEGSSWAWWASGESRGRLPQGPPHSV